MHLEELDSIGARAQELNGIPGVILSEAKEAKPEAWPPRSKLPSRIRRSER
jgi:hypothetical protein